jgi:TonB family protein
MTRRTTAFFLMLLCASLAATQVRPTRVRVREDVMEATLSKRVNPIYPPQARQEKIQGAVVLQVIISKTGDVENIQLISGHPMLAQSAIDAVKQWKYKPYLLNGVAVDVETKVQVNYTLADKSAAQGESATQENGATPQRVRVSENVESGLLEKKVQPLYPQEAKDRHVTGVVVMRMVIDKEGNVANLDAISGDPLLIPPSLDAVRQWKYKPFRLNGTPVEVETDVQVNYTLAN